MTVRGGKVHTDEVAFPFLWRATACLFMLKYDEVDVSY